MDRRWLIPIVLGASLLTWYLIEAFPKLGHAEPATPSQEEQDNPNMRVVRNITYAERADADPSLTQLDVYAPLFEGPHPVVMLVHGGGWRWGDKSSGGLIEGKPAWLTSRGYVLVSFNYRVPPAARHPASAEDVAAAVKWVHDHIGTYGGDPARITLLGHSAGGQLAALVALDGRYLQAAGAPTDAVAGLVLLDGRAYDIPRYLEEAEPWRERSQRWVEAVFGTDPAVYEAASPLRYVAEAAHLPATLVVYRSDRSSSATQGELLVQALQDAGAEVGVLPVANKGHFSLHRELGVVDDEVTRAVEEFLASMVMP